MIAVTGMHRSGTSLVCQLMSALGVSFGEKDGLYASDQWNQEGYFEALPVMDINSTLITGWPRNRTAYETFFSKLVYVFMPGPRRMAGRIEKMRPAIAATSEKYRDCAVKDPRFCLTLPIWDSVARLGHVVVCLRNPDDTVDSLNRRERLPRSIGYRFWSYHMKELLDHLPVERSVFVDMDSLTGTMEGAVSELELLKTALAVPGGKTDLGEIHKNVFRPELFRSGKGKIRNTPEPVQLLWRRAKAIASRRRGEILAG